MAESTGTPTINYVAPPKTKDVAKLIGCGYWKLANALRTGRIDPPAKDSIGNFIWLPADIERARAAVATDLRRKGAKAVEA